MAAVPCNQTKKQTVPKSYVYVYDRVTTLEDNAAVTGSLRIGRFLSEA
jgi:hypothetical protein